MSIKQKIIGVLLAIVAFLGGGYATNLGGTGAVQSTVATSTTRAVTLATQNKLFATSTQCSARIISNQGSALMLTFNDVIPTGIAGHVQAASTTVSYDAEQYGCGAIRAYPYGTQTLTLTETR